jgi:hypothetical protein
MSFSGWLRRPRVDDLDWLSHLSLYQDTLLVQVFTIPFSLLDLSESLRVPHRTYGYNAIESMKRIYVSGLATGFHS